MNEFAGTRQIWITFAISELFTVMIRNIIKRTQSNVCFVCSLFNFRNFCNIVVRNKTSFMSIELIFSCCFQFSFFCLHFFNYLSFGIHIETGNLFIIEIVVDMHSKDSENIHKVSLVIVMNDRNFYAEIDTSCGSF